MLPAVTYVLMYRKSDDVKPCDDDDDDDGDDDVPKRMK